MRKIGPGDISYCSTNCCQERCKRNLRYWKPPTQFCSMCYFDKDCERNVRFNKPTEKYYSMTTFDDIHEDHKHCPWKVKKEEKKK